MNDQTFLKHDSLNQENTMSDTKEISENLRRLINQVERQDDKLNDLIKRHVRLETRVVRLGMHFGVDVTRRKGEETDVQ